MENPATDRSLLLVVKYYPLGEKMGLMTAEQISIIIIRTKMQVYRFDSD